MADFIAVIRRAVDGLSNNTPEMRARVYEKARAAVVRQLENMSPRPPEHMLQRQLDKLDAAIQEVEAEHAEALPAVDDMPTVGDEPPQGAATAAMATAAGAVAASSPAWAEAQPEAEPEPAAAPDEAEPLPEDVQPVDAAAADAPAVSGDDWADAHMAEPAAHVQPEQEPEAEHREEHRAEPLPEPEPVAEAAPADAGWRVEPTFGADDQEPDYERLYDDRAEEPAAVEPEQAPEPESEPEPTVEAPAETAPFHEAPTAEETWSQQDEPEPTTPDWAAEPILAPAEPEPLAPDVSPEPEPYVAPEPPIAAVPVDSVDDWLQSRAQDPAPSIPAASWDLSSATETAANRVPELPEIDPTPVAVSYTPVDEFPAYEEPVRVEPSDDFLAPQSLSLPDADPAVVGALGTSPVGGTVEPDDFSQWFQDHGDETKPPRAGESAPAAEASLEPTEWDEHIDSFAPSAKGAQVEAGGQADGMEALVGGYGQQPSYRLEPKKKRNLAPVIVGALVLVLLAGGGYLAWSMRDDIGSMVANLTGELTPAEQTTEEPASTPAATETPAETATEEAAVTPPATADAASESQKFTQRLRADGTEVDEGVGSAPIEGAPAEGRSVSAQTVASTVEPTDAPAASTGGATTQTPATTADPAAVAGGEKLFLYEERLGQATPVAVPGAISWSAVRENGADGRPDPQIQGRINVPERGISALLTIKRNTDNSLPASHIIEVVFSVPPDFEGGAIENLQRIAMKRTEQDRGDPLVAVTAKVTDDTYLVALNDFEDVVKRNMELLSTRGWMDIPVTYRNGRRALITLDKGTTGGNVFEQVLREWAALTPAAPAN